MLVLPEILPEPLSLLIFYQYDPLCASIGGIQTAIGNCLKYAPADFEVGLVGGLGAGDLALGQWHRREFCGRSVGFLPVIRLGDDDVRQPVPTTLRYTLALARYRSQLRADALHFHRLEPALATLGVAGRRTLFIHNDIPQQLYGSDRSNAILWRRVPQLYLGLEGALIGQFDEVLSCNSESLAFYRRRYPALADRLHPVKNTVDTDRFVGADAATKAAERRRLSASLGLPEATRFLLFAGRFHPQKDPLLLVQALAQLTTPAVHLLLAGSGELEGALRAEVDRLGLGDRVTFLGRLGPDAMAATHRAASAFVLSSRYEGLPMVALEALACGTPVVTTDCGETPRLLTAASGVVVRDRSPAGLAAGLGQVLDRPGQFSPEACAQVAQPYGARAVVAQLFADLRSQLRPAARSLPQPVG